MNYSSYLKFYNGLSNNDSYFDVLIFERFLFTFIFQLSDFFYFLNDSFYTKDVRLNYKIGLLPE